jgi:hypothetical protein
MGQELGWPLSQINAELLNKGSEAIAVGDLLYWDNTNKCARSFSNFADLGSAALMQAAIARLFLGVSNEQALATDATQRGTRTLVDGVFVFACDSNTFEVGDYVGASYNVNVLRNQQVTKVLFRHLALGRVVKRYSAATTLVKCRLLSRYLSGIHARFDDVGSCGQGVGVTALVDAAAVLTVDTNPILTMVPTAARNVNLPAEAQSAGLKFYFSNQSTGAFSVTFLGSAGGAIKGNGVVPQNKTAVLWCDGTVWYGSVSG